MKSNPASATRPSSDTTCPCATLPPLASVKKRQRQWSEQKVSLWPPGQTFTPRLLIIVSLTPSPFTLLIASPRSFADPRVQSRNTSTPTSSLFAAGFALVALASHSSPLLYFLALRICGVCPSLSTTAS